LSSIGRVLGGLSDGQRKAAWMLSLLILVSVFSTVLRNPSQCGSLVAVAADSQESDLALGGAVALAETFNELVRFGDPLWPTSQRSCRLEITVGLTGLPTPAYSVRYLVLSPGADEVIAKGVGQYRSPLTNTAMWLLDDATDAVNLGLPFALARPLLPSEAKAAACRYSSGTAEIDTAFDALIPAIRTSAALVFRDHDDSGWTHLCFGVCMVADGLKATPILRAATGDGFGAYQAYGSDPIDTLSRVSIPRQPEPTRGPRATVEGIRPTRVAREVMHRVVIAEGDYAERGGIYERIEMTNEQLSRVPIIRGLSVFAHPKRSNNTGYNIILEKIDISIGRNKNEIKTIRWATARSSLFGGGSGRRAPDISCDGKTTSLGVRASQRVEEKLLGEY
jgi:hypothetical protein